MNVVSACSENVEIPILLSDIEYEGHVFAHRGVWDCPKSAQNSKYAIQEAIKLKYAGAEIDVRETKDGKIVLSHEADINGLLISESTYDEIKFSMLLNNERIPLLEDILELISTEDNFILMIEDKDACPKTIIELVNKYNLNKNVEFCSFEKYYCEEFIRIAPEIPVHLISYNVPELDMSYLIDNGYSGISTQYTSVYSSIEIINKLEEFGIKTSVWTVNDNSLIDYFIKMGCHYIFTDKVF